MNRSRASRGTQYLSSGSWKLSALSSGDSGSLQAAFAVLHSVCQLSNIRNLVILFVPFLNELCPTTGLTVGFEENVDT